MSTSLLMPAPAAPDVTLSALVEPFAKPAESMKIKGKTLEGFGARLAAIRRGRGITQTELGKVVGVSQRVIAYYETESTQPPGALLVDLARALKVSADELLGLESMRETTSPKTARLLKRLRRIAELPPADQRAVLKLVDAMLDTRRRAAPPPRAKRKAS